MDAAQPRVEPSPDEPPPGVPPLRVHHFLAWVAVSAFGLWINQVGRNPWMSGAGHAIVGLGVLLDAAAAVGCCVLLIALRRPPRPRLSGGHVLAAAAGLILADWLFSLASRPTHEWTDFDLHTLVDESFAGLAPPGLWRPALFLAAAFAIRLDWPWRVTMACYAAQSLTTEVYANAHEWFGDAAPVTRRLGDAWVATVAPLAIAVTLALVVAVGNDLLRGHRRDWIHWAGVGAASLQTLLLLWTAVVYYVLA